MKKSTKDLIQEIKTLLLSVGWEERKSNTFHKTIKERDYRYCFKPTSLRFEVRSAIPASAYSPAQKFWTRIASGYYKDLSVRERMIRGLS